MFTFANGLFRWALAPLATFVLVISGFDLAHAEDVNHAFADVDVSSFVRQGPAALAIGDVIFIRVSAKPFREVAAATNSWTNHVGIVLAVDGKEPLIGESTFPLSRTTTLTKFIGRSEGHRVAVARLPAGLTPEQQQRLLTAATRRAGIFYDTGFDLHSNRQFCSRYVREVLAEATGVQAGEVQTFSDLLTQQPNVNLSFWKLWYFGHIPWHRETVTPASLLRSPQLRVVFDSGAA